MNKILKVIVMFMLVVPIFSSCTNTEDNSNFKIGILQLVEHQSLDECRKGFIEGLAQEGLVAGSNITIDYQNAQGDQSNCTSIANKFVNGKKDLVLAIATPAAQAMVNATNKIPVLVGCVTDPESAGLVKSNSNPGSNVTGVSDLTPINTQIGLIKEILPKAKRLGIFYCANEANSKYQADIAIIEAEKLGLEPLIYTVSQLSEVKNTVEHMVEHVDVIYTPTDNIVASSIGTISDIAKYANIPIVCGDVNLVSQGCLGTYGMSYYELGKLNAVQAVKILRHGVYPGDIAVDYAKKPTLVLNSDVIKKLDIKLSEDVISKAKFI